MKKIIGFTVLIIVLVVGCKETTQVVAPVAQDKQYVVRINQALDSLPRVDVIQNDLGEDPVWYRENTGEYYAIIAGYSDASKAYSKVTISPNAGRVKYVMSSVISFQGKLRVWLYILDENKRLSDNLLRDDVICVTITP